MEKQAQNNNCVICIITPVEKTISESDLILTPVEITIGESDWRIHLENNKLACGHSAHFNCARYLDYHGISMLIRE